MKLGEVLIMGKSKSINIIDDEEYTIAGVQSYGKGVVNRRRETGKNLKMKKYQIIEDNYLMWCKVDTKNGAFGITKKDHIGSLASTNMALGRINPEKVNPEFLERLFTFDFFHSHITHLSSGTTNRKYLTPIQLCNLVEIPDLSKKDQDNFIELVNKIEKLKIDSELNHQLQLVKQLRQSFLREAMQGKLVKSKNIKETGEQLLAKIKAEKVKLIAEKKLKKEKELQSITKEEIPFEIPKHWAWCRLGAVCAKIGSGSTPKGSNYAEFGKPFFRSQNVHDNGLVYDDIKFVSDEVQKQMNGTVVIANDILLNITGGSMARCALVPNDFDEGNVSQHVCIIRPLSLNNIFLHKLILSPYFQKLIFGSTTGAGREGLPKYNLEQFIIPLPPLHEQEQIVAKLDELMSFCDGLEQSIKESQAYNEMLLQQVLREALQPNENTKIINIESRKIENPLKTILAGHIINLNNTTDFGRVKFQKLLFLTEYICKIDFGSNYIRKVAGPYDDVLIKGIEADFNRMRFFNVVQDNTDNKRVRYHALAGATELESLFQENFPDELVKTNNTLLKFRPLSWAECELIATLYAVWNNRIIKNEPITDELLYNDFMAWDKQKSKYQSVFYKWLFWMKDERIIPDGWGKYIDKPQLINPLAYKK